MRLLQRYILIELVRTFGFLLTVLTVLLVFVGVIREASESGLGPMQIVQILPFIISQIFQFIDYSRIVTGEDEDTGEELIVTEYEFDDAVFCRFRIRIDTEFHRLG